MSRTVSIGKQNFESMITGQYFYVDKTRFIREWWENGDDVTLITRPRRFGKTLTLNMVETFFSVEYSDKRELFAQMDILKEECYRKIQGTYPVIFLSFAEVKEKNFEGARKKICQLISDLYSRYSFLLKADVLTDRDRNFLYQVSETMEDYAASMSVKNLSQYLSAYYNKKVILLLDEYDTPMQEAYMNGYWKELTEFLRGIFNSSFKTNPYMERALLIGITRVSKESIFSDLNNLVVVTTTSGKYADCFGFTEKEVFAALDEYGSSDRKEKVKDWYDGFIFGNIGDIYNPWSITNYLSEKKLKTYWANTSSNSLVSKLIREGNRTVKMNFEQLLQGKTILMYLDEQIIFEQLDRKESAVWSLLLASGYLKVLHYLIDEESGRERYELALTNKEVRIMFEGMIRDWFSEYEESYNDFIKALLVDDVEAMNLYMNQVALSTFSYFDTGRQNSKRGEPERFYHGFVLGLMVDLAGRYMITSNRESGFGRYDVMLEPKRKEDDALILEFKVRNPAKEKTLSDTAKNALDQIKTMDYASVLESKGICQDRIRIYGFAFEGKKVWIESSDLNGSLTSHHAYNLI